MLDTHFASQYPDMAHFSEIEKILSFVKAGNSSQVVGLPGAGKSNILELLAYNKRIRIKHLGENQSKFHFVYTNFSEVRGKPMLDIMKFLFIELVDSLEEREFEDAYRKSREIFKESIGFQDEMVLFQGFKKAIDYLTGEKELTIVFLFDRFETYIPSVTADFFNNLRVLRNRAKYRFSAVFALNRPLEDTIEPAIFADYYEFLAGHTIFVPLQDEVVRNFRVKYLEEATGKKATTEQLDKLAALTAGHGKLLRVCLETILSHGDQPIPDAPSLLSHKPVLGGLYEIWYFLNPSEQRLLAESVSTNTTVDSVFLTDIGLLHDGKIAIPLFETFVEQQAAHLSQSSASLTYDGETKTITKGGNSISDKLTVSEFRLLRFLLEHPNTILDREAVINAVWTDAKATAGVTDQAVDQLIFRLRKKIEDDPNNPKHLETIKGRGVKFTS